MFSRRNESLERHRIAQRWKILYIILLLVIFVVHICLVVLYIIYRISEENQYWVSFIILKIISIYFCNFFLCRFIYKVTDTRTNICGIAFLLQLWYFKLGYSSAISSCALPNASYMDSFNQILIKAR